MNDDLESREYNIGMPIMLIRVGNIVYLLFSNKLEAKRHYQELAEKYEQAEKEHKNL